MIKAAIEGKWFAIGRLPERTTHQLVPPIDWNVSEFDIQQGKAGRDGLYYEDLLCAFAEDVPKGHYLDKQFQALNSRKQVLKNINGGRPSNMPLYA